ncbi:unnamed protein product [Owenia fusiformis]|uniref:Uncharacterized protein n=1 Tax=Owenia fusiformis TaxID=6347 RepID=A0A8S4NPN2_OWEFU|nr:unnamed protein product [Owenia fusiformis]
MDTYESTFTIKEEVLSESDDTYVSESTFAREHEPEAPLSDLKPENEQSVETDCVGSVYNDKGNQRSVNPQVDYDKLSKQCKVLLNKQDVEKHLQTKCRADIPDLCIKEEDTDTDTIIDESDDSLSEEATDVIDEKFCAVDLEHIIPNTVSRKRKKVHNTLDDKLDALSDVTFSESSSSSDTDSSWSPSESGISTIHRKKRRKTKNFIERDDNNGSHDNGSEKQDTKPNMNFYLPRKVTFPFKMVSKVGGRTNNKDEYKGQGHVRTLLPKPKVLCYNIAPAKAMAKCVAASIKDREKSDVTTAATQSGADAQKQSTINTQKQSVQNATSPVKNHWPTFPLNLLPQRVLSKSIKSKGKIIMNNRPRLSIPQNNQQRLQVNKNNQPRLPIPQSNQPRLTISQNNQPRLLSQTNQPITMILQNNQQMAMTPQMNQPRPTIIQTIEPRAMIQQNLPEPKAVISPNNQPIVTIDPSKTTPNILRLPIVPQNILPQNILPQNILPQNVIYIPQSATPGTLVNPTSVNSSAVYPTAVNPTAVNPSAVNPSVVNPTAVNPTTLILLYHP